MNKAVRRLWARRSTPLVGQLTWSALGQITVAVAGLIGVRVLTELAPPEVFGTANLLITMLVLAINIGVAPVANTQLRYHSRFAAEGNARGFSGEVLKLSLWSALGFSLVAAVGYGAWALAHGQRFGFLLAALLLAWVPLFAIRNALINRVGAERRQALQALWQGSEAILIIILSAVLLAIAPTTEMFLAGNLLAVALTVAAIAVFSPAVRDIALDGLDAGQKSGVRALVRRYGFPFAVLGLLSWVGNLADRYVLAAMLGVAAVGQYAASFGIASRAMLMTGSILTNAFRPALFEAESHGQPDRARRLYRFWLAATALLVAVLVGFFYAGSSLLAELLLAEPYRAAARGVMTLVAIGYGIQAINQVVECRIMSLGSSSRLIWPMGVGGAGNLAFAFLLIPLIGLSGAALANAAGFCLQLITSLWMLRNIQAGAGNARIAPDGDG